MNKPVILTLMLSSMVLVAGCGTSHHKQTTTSAQSNTVISELPVSVSNKLSDAKKRLHHVKTLPVKQNISGKSILFLSPTEAYAIKQFRSVWPQLKHKPTVVWTGTNKSNAEAVWKREDYSQTPLSSQKTYFIQDSPPTPDAYEKTTSGWNELPGILSKQQTHFWIGFFNKLS